MRVIAGLLSVLLLAGCVARTEPSSSPRTTSPTACSAGTIPEPPPVEEKDQAEVNYDFSLSVGLTESHVADFSAEGIEEVADSIVAQLRAAGTDDAETTHRASSETAGRPVLDFRVSFTAGTGNRSIWFVRTIGNGTRAVQLQSIAFAAPADEASVTAIVEKYHQQLIGTVRIPRSLCESSNRDTWSICGRQTGQIHDKCGKIMGPLVHVI